MSESNATVHSMPIKINKDGQVRKKVGRKGDNISNTFKDLPISPVNSKKYNEYKYGAKDYEDRIPKVAVGIEEMAAQHGISHKTLRQVKRHDGFGEKGKVYIRTHPKTNKSMIWREHS